PDFRRDDDRGWVGQMLGKYCYVYLLASGRNGTLYAGVTNDLVRRVWEHKQHAVPGFTRRYEVTNLVWFEVHESISSAIQREKRIKEWRRNWKIELFRDSNPDWTDLYPSIAGQ
ncbi:MAG: GIY-YIG nuclease family protein, partial [Devosia sp.]